MERQAYNRTIIKILSELVEKYPYLRFVQILVNIEAIKLIPSDKYLLAQDPYYEEPDETLKRILMSNAYVSEQFKGIPKEEFN